MLSSVPGSVDGVKVSMYEADREYDLTGSLGARELAAAFVAAGLAEAVAVKPALRSSTAAVDVEPGVDALPTTKPGRKPKAP